MSSKKLGSLTFYLLQHLVDVYTFLPVFNQFAFYCFSEHPLRRDNSPLGKSRFKIILVENKLVVNKDYVHVGEIQKQRFRFSHDSDTMGHGIALGI